jgi:hypothetical protein
MAAGTEENAVLTPIQKFFDGIAHRNATDMRAAAIPGAIMLFMRDGGPSQSPIEQYAERVARPGPPLEESIHDAVIRVDNDLASSGHLPSSKSMARSIIAQPIFSP